MNSTVAEVTDIQITGMIEHDSVNTVLARGILGDEGLWDVVVSQSVAVAVVLQITGGAVNAAHQHFQRLWCT